MEIFTNKERKRFPLQKINNNGGIFEIKKCKCNCAGDLEEGNEIMYIGAKKDENGFMRMVKKDEKMITKGNCIIFICDGEGSVGYSNYMDRDFIGSTTLSVGYNKELNQNIGLFLVTLLDLERKKYSYGRKYGTNLPNTKIKLPINNNGEPDREFMENYVKALHYKPITTKNKLGKSKLDVNERKYFKLGNLFDIDTGKDFIYNEATGNDFIVIGHGVDNNGIACRTEKLDNYNLYNHRTTLSLGHIGNFIAYVQPSDFYLGTRTKALKIKENLSTETMLFVSTIINKQSYKFSYGRVGSDKIPNLEIKLPIKKDLHGNPIIDKDNKYSDEGYIPDREFMENYIKNLPYGDRI